MKQLIKDMWIAALRSGQYSQCSYVLARVNRNNELEYCALGVLADICSVPKVQDGYEVRFKFHKDQSIGHAEGLSEHLRKEIRFPMCHESKIIKLNDLENKTFEEIAGWIDKNIYGD